MMSQSDSHSGDRENNAADSSPAAGPIDKNTDFGSLLAEARKTKNYSVEEVSEYLKIPANTITAIETSNKDALPAPTFTQGYIRAYAKFLEISEEEVLVIYNRAVPHDDVSDLKPRSNLPGETNSQSPLIKAITMSLIFAGIAAVIFGGFQYYQKKAGDMESELENKQQSFTGSSLDSPASNRLIIKQDAYLADDELVVDKAESTAADAEEDSLAKDSAEQTGTGKAAIEDTSADQTAAKKPVIVKPAIEKKLIKAPITPITTKTASSASATERSRSGTFAEAIAVSAENTEVNSANEKDIVEISAENGSWVEVRDANNSRLLYNMLPAGSSKVLVGSAPFSISMGNARTTRVVVNELEVDVSSYIRANNTASFKVSTQGQKIIFH